MSRIDDITKGLIPTTWDALNNASTVGPTVLAARVQFAEEMIWGSVPSDTTQNNMSTLVADFIAKYAAIQIIDVALDYWREQPQSITTTGTAEVESYGDRLAFLRERKSSLIEELAQLAPQVDPLIPNELQRRTRPLISTIDDPLLSPSPQDLGPAFGPLTVSRS
jgi:hypothetical protein